MRSGFFVGQYPSLTCGSTTATTRPRFSTRIDAVWADSPGSRLDGTCGPETTTEWFTSLEEQLPSLVELRGKDISNLADYLGDHTATFFNAKVGRTNPLL